MTDTRSNTPDRPVTVEQRDPPLPEVAFRVVNPVLTLLLRSPLHGLVSDGLTLITFTGRTSGEQYTTPIGYHRVPAGVDAEGVDLLAFNDSGWWRNLRGGAPVTLRLRGQRVEATATAVPDDERTAEYVRAVLEEEGPGYANRLGLAVEGDRVPTVEELAAGIEDTVAIELVLDEHDRDVESAQ